MRLPAKRALFESSLVTDCRASLNSACRGASASRCAVLLLRQEAERGWPPDRGSRRLHLRSLHRAVQRGHSRGAATRRGGRSLVPEHGTHPAELATCMVPPPFSHSAFSGSRASASSAGGFLVVLRCGSPARSGLHPGAA